MRTVSRPMAAHRLWSDSVSDTWTLLPGSAHQEGGVGTDEEWAAVQVYRPRHNYAVRRAFLTSYQFSVRESFGKRMARAVRQLAVDAVSVLRGGIPAGRVVSPRRMVRALCQGLHHLIPSSLSPVRCFVGGAGRSKCVAARVGCAA